MSPGAKPRRRRAGLTRSGPKLAWGEHRVLLAALVALGFLISGASGAVAYFLPALTTALKVTGHATTGKGAKGGKQPSQPTPPPPGQPFTVLLLGSDNDAKTQGGPVLTQTMILVRVDPKTHAVVMLSIPRDLWVPLASGGSAKIDAAYEQGQSEDAVQTVESNFKVTVNYWAWIGLNGLVGLVDQLGGVDSIAQMPVLDVQYPYDLTGTNPYANQRVAILPGPQRLNGVNALTYVRSRHGALLEDIARNQKQQELLVDIKDSSKHLNLTDIPRIASALGTEVSTDISLSEVGAIAGLAKAFSNGDVQELVMLGSDYTAATEQVNGATEDVLLPNWPAINSLIAQNFSS